MATNTAQIKELLSTANQLNTQDLGNFIQQARDLLFKRTIPSIPQEEANLLLRIQEATPVQLLERAALLHQKRRAENLTVAEQTELLQLTEVIEKQHIVRMELLIELSKLRGVPLKTVMDELGILPFPSHG